ncbi:hypothetical protein GBF35_22750 [Nonomuraea phyllanthi]|uniref:hypothetical protein n=1 Tax=Nonomuraea phyllanthi TaxID=2219224 RepID=UPI0012934339|nr:hypothetical protein [Nonomuraea phyllanthi]QFY09112.1 hypothetical protein GBF35_22750 [Nonomuraea phyllanthi]
MRRYRFGGIAALIALVHLAAVTVLGALALATDQGDLLWQLVTRNSSLDWYAEPGKDTFALPWGLTLLLIPIGALQAWALWQVLRGPARGEPARRGRSVALLRLALYAGVACGLVLVAGSPLILALRISWIWSAMGIVSAVVQLAVVWLFFLVLRDTVSRGLRVFSLVAGTVAGVSGLGQEIAGLFDALSATRILNLAGGYGFVSMAWCVSILIAQARDRRWSAATVRIGVIAQVVAFLQPDGFVTFGGNGFPSILTFYTLLGAVSVFGLVWEARTAHELAGPVPLPLPQREPGRAVARWWPLAALAVALPLLPAALNLARGRYLSIGPRGVIEEFVRVNGGSTNAMAWFALDAFVGVGGPALLVLVAVLRRTRRVLRTTTLALSVVAAVAVVSASRATPPSWEFGYEGTQIYPEGMFTRGADGEVFLGISPSWYGAALLASALLLLVLYPAAPARRVRRHVLPAGLATLLALAFVPAADQTRGPVTAAEDCVPHDRWTGEPQVPELTRDQRLVCSLRQANVIAFAATTPDSVILAHARRLCGVYTRNDPEEVARLRAVEGLTREVLTYPLAQVCPSAAAVVSAATAERERENQEWEDDARRMCDASPRHRPRIEPARAVRLREPQWTDYGVLDAYEPTEDGADPFDDGLLERAQDDGLVAALPGHLMVLTHSDFDICVTLETYDRRPPVETRGWDHVAEVGYLSPTGRIVLRDDLSGTELPDLSLDGRAGHYRIRVHYDWFDWKGPQTGGQRLLIMAFPGKGDRPVTHRKPRERG